MGRGGRRFKSAHPDHLFIRKWIIAKKADGVVEAAHFSKSGDLLWVRAYERRGPTWSDVVLLDREHLVKRIESGKRFFVGKRKKFLASEFQLREQILVNKNKSGKVLSLGKDKKADTDQLQKLPRL